MHSGIVVPNGPSFLLGSCTRPDRRFFLAFRQPLSGRRAQRRNRAAGPAVPLHHAPGIGQRAPAMQRRRAVGTQTQDRVARWHHPHRRWSSCSGWHAGAAPEAASDPIPWLAGAGLPSCAPWGCGMDRAGSSQHVAASLSGRECGFVQRHVPRTALDAAPAVASSHAERPFITPRRI